MRKISGDSLPRDGTTPNTNMAKAVNFMKQVYCHNHYAQSLLLIITRAKQTGGFFLTGTRLSIWKPFSHLLITTLGDRNYYHMHSTDVKTRGKQRQKEVVAKIKFSYNLQASH